MRCPSCGTQNEPDSRFCGGCGARLHGTLAPTHKIVPDPQVVAAQPAPSLREQQAQAIARQVSAEYAAQRQPSAPQPVQPQRSTPVPQAVPPSAPQNGSDLQRPRSSSQQPVRSRSNSVPQGVYAPPRTTPASGGGAIGSQPRSSRALDEPIAVPRRRWGLILFVLVFDLGLAAAGVYLLNEGLSANRAPDPTPPTKVGAAEPPPAAPAPTPPPPAPVAAPIDAGAVAATTPPSDAAPGDAGDPPGDAAVAVVSVDAGPTQGRKQQNIVQRKTGGGKPGPVDPYADDPKSNGPTLGPQPVDRDDEDDDPIERRDERRR
jgi:zinc-ribbon domain